MDRRVPELESVGGLPHHQAMMTIDDIAVEPPAEGAMFDAAAVFGSPGPFEVEIGCGKGGFLLARARSHPEVRLLGIEWANKFFKFAADRMARWGLTNVRVMRTDARTFVMKHLAPECLRALHLYHPDPWPKKRHHKRRLVQADFVAAAVRALEPGGTWFVQSDHREYFEQMVNVLGTHPELVRLDGSDAESEVSADWKGTNFEIKYSREGREIYRAAFRRKVIRLGES